MTDERKQEFTLRITNANISELTVILCDMFTEYCSDAKNAIDNDDRKQFHIEIGRARRVLSELINSLDRSLELANCIYELYRFSERMLIKADIKLDKTFILNSENVINKLNESYRKISSQDKSGPLMRNTEEVYAGMTYGKYDVSSATVGGNNRGFLA